MKKSNKKLPKIKEKNKPTNNLALQSVFKNLNIKSNNIFPILKYKNRIKLSMFNSNVNRNIRKIINLVDIPVEEKMLEKKLLKKYIIWTNSVFYHEKTSFIFDNIYLLREKLEKIIENYKTIDRSQNFLRIYRKKTTELSQALKKKDISSRGVFLRTFFYFKSHEREVIQNKLKTIYLRFFIRAVKILEKLQKCNQKKIKKKNRYRFKVLYRNSISILEEFFKDYKEIVEIFFLENQNYNFVENEYKFVFLFIKTIRDLIWSQYKSLISIMDEQRIFVFVQLKPMISKDMISKDMISKDVENNQKLFDLLQYTFQLNRNYSNIYRKYNLTQAIDNRNIIYHNF